MTIYIDSICNTNMIIYPLYDSISVLGDFVLTPVAGNIAALPLNTKRPEYCLL